MAEGAPIAELVPRNDKLIVEAQVRPEDIDNVHVNRGAEVRLTAYKQREVPTLIGRVVYVSPDRITDAQRERKFYLAKIEVDGESLKALKSVELVAGMPAEVYIKTGERTALSYFFTPLATSFNRAFRED